MYVYVYGLKLVLLKIYLNTHFLRCPIHVTDSVICWCITKQTTKLKQLQWLNNIDTAHESASWTGFGGGSLFLSCWTLAGLGQRLGVEIIWCFIHMHFRCWTGDLQIIGAEIAVVPWIFVHLPVVRGVFLAWLLQGRCTSYLLPQG